MTTAASSRRYRASVGRRLAWGGMALLSSAIALVSYRYLIGKGPIPPNIAENMHFSPWIILHAGGAATALLLGPWQFLPNLRQRHPGVHRAIGRLYVAGCASGGIAALVLAAGVSSGPVSGAGFAALGIAWLTTTGMAIREVLSGRVASHRRWMIRSFALTLSAVTLRTYLPLSGVLGLEFMPAYSVIAWACWVPNALLAELYMAGSRKSAPLLSRDKE